MTDTTTFTLPWPPAALSPNARVHRLAKARAASAYRVEVWLSVRAQLGVRLPGYERAAMRLTFVMRDRRRRDFDNLLASLKPALDTLSSPQTVTDTTPRLGLLVDDDTTHLTLTLAARYEAHATPRVEVVLDEEDAR